MAKHSHSRGSFRFAAWPLVAAVALVGAACATASGGARSLGEPVPFFNTTDACDRAAPVSVAVSPSGAASRVEPGDVASLSLGDGAEALVVSSIGEPPEELARLPLDDLGDPGRPAYFGCAAPEHLTPGPGLAPLRIVHHPYGCGPGRQGSAVVRREGRALGHVAPATTVTRFVPEGALSLEVAMTLGASPAGGDVACVGGRLDLIVAPDGAEIALGRSPQVATAGGLAPLVLLGPEASCPVGTHRRIRAAGVDTVLTPGEAYTLFVPRGPHRVALSDGDGPEQELVLDLGAEGGLIAARVCPPGVTDARPMRGSAR